MYWPILLSLDVLFIGLLRLRLKYLAAAKSIFQNNISRSELRNSIFIKFSVRRILQKQWTPQFFCLKCHLRLDLHARTTLKHDCGSFSIHSQWLKCEGSPLLSPLPTRRDVIFLKFHLNQDAKLVPSCSTLSKIGASKLTLTFNFTLNYNLRDDQISTKLCTSGHQD